MPLTLEKKKNEQPASENDQTELSRQEEELQSTHEEAADADDSALPSQQNRDLFSGNEQSLRRSERERSLPSKFLDYFTGFSASAVGFPFSSDVPETYKDIDAREDRDLWYQAVDDELKSMMVNAVWKLTTCPASVRPLKTKWVFRLKEDETGRQVRHKARLVVKGFLQRPGIDFEDTYAPVAKLSTVRVVLAVAVNEGFDIHQMDVKTAFLHGILKEELYMEVPDGVQAKPGIVCKLGKSLYGLKQAPRCWNERFNSTLLKLGFRRSNRDYCLYVSTEKGDTMYLLLYVDDLLIVGRNIQTIEKLKRCLADEFEMTDCGPTNFFLGMRVEYNRTRGELKLSQEAAALKILEKYGMTQCNPAKSPMEKGLQLNREGRCTTQPYRESLGSLMYQMLCVRPDLCFPVAYMGRFQQSPTEDHWQALKRIMRYLKGTTAMGLNYKKQNDTRPLVGYVDADWAADLEDRKSVTGFMFKVFGSTVSWTSRKQATVSLSSSESEYVALSAAVSEGIWLAGLLEDMNCKSPSDPVIIYEDNRGCIGLAKNAESKRIKHLDIKHHFIKEHVAAGNIKIEPISTTEQQADIFTKALDVTRFQWLRTKIGVAN